MLSIVSPSKYLRHLLYFMEIPFSTFSNLDSTRINCPPFSYKTQTYFIGVGHPPRFILLLALIMSHNSVVINAILWHVINFFLKTFSDGFCK